MQPLDLGRLRPLYKDDPDELSGLIRDTVLESAALLGRLDRAIEAQSPEAMDIAHEMRGLCATAGAVELAALCEELERLASGDSWNELPAYQVRMHEAQERFRVASVQLE